MPAKDAELNWLTASHGHAPPLVFQDAIDGTRKLHETGCEDLKFVVRLMSGVASVAGVAPLLISPSGDLPEGAAFEIEPYLLEEPALSSVRFALAKQALNGTMSAMLNEVATTS